MFSSTYLSLVCLICCPNGVDVQEVVFGVVSKNVEINCSIPETQPEWRGPPTLVVYFNADASATVNPSLPNKDRVSVNANGNLVISSAEVTDGGEFRCSYFADSVLFDVRIGCRLLDIPQHGSVNSTFGYPGDTAVFSCNQSYGLSGTEILTCLADGSWTADEPECESTTTTPGTTTTSTLTTSTTSSTTSMMTSSAIATITSSLRTSTASISASTTTTMAHTTVTSTKSTVKPTSTSRGTITRTSPVATTVPHVSDGDSDKAIVTMIIVVSVIGGILIVAIFSIIFVMMHWKSCFTRRGHSKQYAQRSDHRKQHRQAGYNASGRFFTNRQDHAMRGYYFYYGTYKNPLFYDPYENTSYVNNYYPNQKNSHDPKNMSSHKVYQNNYDRN